MPHNDLKQTEIEAAQHKFRQFVLLILDLFSTASLTMGKVTSVKELKTDLANAKKAQKRAEYALKLMKKGGF